MLLVEKKMNHPIVNSLLESDLEQLPLRGEALELIAHAHAQVGHTSKALQFLQRLENAQHKDVRPNIHRIATMAYLGKKNDAAIAYAEMMREGARLHEVEKKYLEEILRN
jgi:hypothetical protein